MIKRKLLFALLMVLSLVFTAQAQESVLRAGFSTTPGLLDPGLSYTSLEFTLEMQLFEGLTALAPQESSLLPGVAESWDISEDGLTYTFYLRENARWSDGEPVTADSFKYAWLRALHPETKAPYAFLLFYIKQAKAYHEGKASADEVGISVKDPLTLQVTLEKLTPFFLQLTAFPVYMPVPEHCLRAYGDRWTSPEHIIGNGPFLLEERPSQQQLTMSENSSYWDRDKVSLSRVEFYFFDDSKAALQLYRDKKLDWLNGLISTEIRGILKDPDAVRFPVFSTMFYRINTTHPALSDRRVRKALSLALNRGNLCRKALAGGELPAFTLVPPRISGYPKYAGERENPEKARQLLREAGYPDGQGFPRLKISLNTCKETALIAETIRDMWKAELNIDVALDPQEWSVWRSRMRELEYELTPSAWMGDYVDPSTFLDVFEERDGSLNRTGWADPEYARLLKEARQEQSQDIRFARYHDAEKILIDAAPIIPLYHGIVVYLLSPNVSGISPNPMNLHPLKYVTIGRELK